MDSALVKEKDKTRPIEATEYKKGKESQIIITNISI